MSRPKRSSADAGGTNAGTPAHRAQRNIARVVSNRARRLPPRHSAATVRAGRSTAGSRSVAIALGANMVEAGAKFAAGAITGSSAMLSEGVHSTADSVNEVLLAVSLRRARRPSDTEHPFGYGGERFLGAFLAAITSFVVGGCVSIGLAIRDLATGGEVGQFAVAWAVLAVAAVADGTSIAQSIHQARREAKLWDRSTLAYLRHTSDPTLRAIVVEDGASLVGVGLAAGALLVHELGGPAQADGIASLLIGLLLAVTAVGLARPLADLLIGKSIPPGRLEMAYRILVDAGGIDEVLSMYAVNVGPQEAILAAKVHPSEGQTADDLARLLDDLDGRLRTELPEIGEVFIDVTAHHGVHATTEAPN